jgi:hypothetical protein
MYRRGRYLLAGGLVLVMLALAVGLRVPAATALSEGDSDPVMEMNRTLKGDRLPAVPAAKRPKPADLENPSIDRKLPDGCESVVSPITRSSLARTAGRCVS